MLNTFLMLLVGAVAGGGGIVMVRVVRRERAERRAQVQSWDEEWARAYAAMADEQIPAPAVGGPRPGETATFRMPASPARPVVVDAVVVDKTSERAR